MMLRTSRMVVRMLLIYYYSSFAEASSIGISGGGRLVKSLGITGSSPVITVKGGKPWTRARLWRSVIRVAAMWSDQ